MKASQFLFASFASLATCQTSALPDSYLNSVCSPNITESAGAIIPPCESVVNIQTRCQINGTTPLDYLAHAECMCSPPSTFFADWLGCRQCLFVHGGLTQMQLSQYSAIISAASNALCTGTPTADFQSLFTQAGTAAVSVTSGSVVYSDQFPSSTAVSLYYTATGSQGAGAITGSAAAATAQSLTTSKSLSTSRATGTSSSRQVSGSTSSSSGGAMVTRMPQLQGVALAVVGGLAAVMI